MSEPIYVEFRDAEWHDWHDGACPGAGSVWFEWIDGRETRRCERWGKRWFFARERLYLGEGRESVEELNDSIAGWGTIVEAGVFDDAWRRAWDLGVEIFTFDERTYLDLDPARSVHRRWPIKARAFVVRPQGEHPLFADLTLAGWTVTGEQDPNDAVDAIAANPPDVVIINVDGADRDALPALVDAAMRIEHVLAGLSPRIVVIGGDPAGRRRVQTVARAIDVRRPVTPADVERFRSG